MQVSRLSAQLGLGSQLVDWYRDATSVPYGHLLIDLPPRTNDQLRYFTNTAFIPSKFFTPDWLKPSEILDDEHTKLCNSPSAPIAFPKRQEYFLSVFSKRFYPVSPRMHSKPFRMKPAKRKKTIYDKISRQITIALPKKYHLEAS